MTQAAHSIMTPGHGGAAAITAVPAGAGSEPARATAVALHENRPDDAVRRFLQALDEYAMPAADLLANLRQVGGEESVQRLVLAFGRFGCPHCRGGADTCPGCGGGGHGEDRRFACRTCSSLGAVSCDFCGGSGFATYSFVPEPLRASVAASRVALAAHRVADHLKRPLPANVAREQLSALRKTLARQLLGLQRDVAILANAAQAARELRASRAVPRPFAGRLFTTASQHARAAQRRVGAVLQMLSKVSRLLGSFTADPDAAAFEEERAELFESLARAVTQSAARRSSVFPGH